MEEGWCHPPLNLKAALTGSSETPSSSAPSEFPPLASSSISGGIRANFALSICYRGQNSMETIAQEDPVAVVKAACIASAAT
jgi:hypothetical protein